MYTDIFICIEKMYICYKYEYMCATSFRTLENVSEFLTANQPDQELRIC